MISFSPIINKGTAELQNNKRGGNEGPQDRKHCEAVRGRLKRGTVRQGVGRKAHLHRCQDNCNVDGDASEPRKVIVEEGAIPIPPRHIPAKGCLVERVDFIQATQAQLAVKEAAVDAGVDVFCVQLLYEYAPCGPGYLWPE